MSESPYKKFKAAKSEYVPYTNISKFTPNKPYQVYDIVEVNGAHGPGQLAFFIGEDRKKCKAYLPRKFLKNLKIPEDIDVFKADIKANKPPYLIYRGTLGDNSYNLDLSVFSQEMKTKHEKWEDVPELDSSAEDDSHVVQDSDQIENSANAKEGTAENGTNESEVKTNLSLNSNKGSKDENSDAGKN